MEPERIEPAAETGWWPWVKRHKFPVSVGVALLVGIGVGAASAGGDDEPSETVREVEVPGETITETVERTPQACLDALAAAEVLLGYAEQGFAAAGDGFQAAGSGIEAALALDIASVEVATDQILEANDRIVALTGEVEATGPSWLTAREECRAGA